MGAAVFRDIPEKRVAMGNLARVILNNETKKVFNVD